MRTKYFNDGLVGNNNIKASFTKNGELIRLLYGAADYKQFVDLFHVGMRVNESGLIYLHNDVNNSYTQEYVKDTNILKTEIFNSYYKIKVIQNDFVPVDEKFLVRYYTFKNENTINLDVNLLAYSRIFTNLNNETAGYFRNNSLLQYNHDFTVCIFSDQKALSRQINDVDYNIMSGKIDGKDYIGMSQASAISFDIKTIKPGEEKTFCLYIYINKNKEKDLIRDLDREIDRIRELDEKNMFLQTKKYWHDFLKEHDIMGICKNDLVSNKVKKVYSRSILLFPLLINRKTGGISAGIEVDEDKTKCGRYSFCWPRDAVFITKALDLVGMKDCSDDFYLKFCKMTQDKTGMWEQRFYTDGRLAPCWGYQIDETASVIYGVYDHFLFTNDIDFLDNSAEMCEKATEFLLKYTDDIFSGQFKMQPSYDLWEMYEGYSLYSLSCVYGALVAMQKIYDILLSNGKINENVDVKKNVLNETAIRLKEYCIIKFYDDNKKTLVRNNNDRKVDISLLGATIPFNMIDIEDKLIKNTVEKINLTLRTYTGGYVRYEGDSYMGGYSPWPIATLWMAWYYLELGDVEMAEEIFSFVTNSASSHGLIGEQVNNDAMKPSWVIGLTWSHAMYIIVLSKLLEFGDAS
ncbi:MAG: hypothetical protein K6D97_06520 [Clostridia bacterium]|nr:hypothetical protein [Clostridia bacterium]